MPKVVHNALSPAKLRTLRTPGAYADGNGLTFRVDARGNRRWIQRVTISGKRRNLGLGSYPVVGLKEARATAVENLLAIREGRNPIEEKRRAREIARRPVAPTFAEAASTVIEMRRPTWSSDRHAQQWEESLRLHVFPVIGSKPVDQVTTADTLAVLTPIWTSKAETATRVRQRMETVFDWCIGQEWRTDNPASTSIAKALPRRARLKQHHPALPFTDVPGALHLIRESTADPTTRLAFEFMVLTAARAGEVRGASWEEMDLDSHTWTVPAERMKARREHRVPLSDRALEILVAAREHRVPLSDRAAEILAATREHRVPLSDRAAEILAAERVLVFPAKRNGKPLTNMAFSMLLRRLDIAAVPHGFRSSFRDWAIERTDVSWAVGEAALAHNLGNSVESAYARTELLELRRGLMQQWADFLAK